MARLLLMLLLMPGLLLAQDSEEDDEEIVIDETPEGEDDAPTKPAPEPKTHPKREKGKKPGKVKIKEKVYEFRLPDDWAARPFDAARGELGFDLKLPGSDQRSRLTLVREETMGPARTAPLRFREWALKNDRRATAEIQPRPWPQLVVSTDNRGLEWRVTYLFLEVKGNPYYFEFQCPADEFEQAQNDLHAIAASFKADVEWWPPPPKGYGIVEKGNFVFATHPALKRSIKPLQKALKNEEKAFAKVHGRLPKDTRILVLVHESRETARSLLAQAADTDSGYYADANGRRLFAVPLAKNNRDAIGFAAGAARGVLLMLKYGDTRPNMVWAGERGVARASAMTGKPLPNLHAGFTGWLDGATIRRLDEIENLKPNADDFGKQSLFYTCMFHAGKYKKEYRAFLKEYAETGDGEAAFKTHIGSIDSGKLRDAVQDYMFNKIKSFKPK